MANEFGRVEVDAACPVSLDLFGQLYRASDHARSELLLNLSEPQRPRLALFCYNRAHLRDLAVAIAAKCDPEALLALAGTVGEVLSVQCRTEARKAVPSLARRLEPARAKVSLARVSA